MIGILFTYHLFTCLLFFDPPLFFIDRFSDDGANFSINSDDPLPFDTNLTKEFEFAKEMGINEDKLITCVSCVGRPTLPT